MPDLSRLVPGIEIADPKKGGSITRTSVAEVAQGDLVEGVRSIAACEFPATISIGGLGAVDWF